MIDGILKRNGFEERDANLYYNGKCYITLRGDHYEVSHYDEDFLEYMDWFSNDLSITALMGFLSWNDFIPRGYEK